MNDPKVLAGLQAAYLASDDERVHRSLMHIWGIETDTRSTAVPSIGDRIRAWEPPVAEPSLADRVASLEQGSNELVDSWQEATNRLADEEAVNRRQWDTINNLSARLTTAEGRINATRGMELGNADSIAALERGLATLTDSVQSSDRAYNALTGRMDHWQETANDQLIIFNTFSKMTEARLTALGRLRPEAAPDDPVCAREGCGHPENEHDYPNVGCLNAVCKCPAFLPAPPAAPLDSVLTGEQIKALRLAYSVLRDQATQAMARKCVRETVDAFDDAASTIEAMLGKAVTP